MNITTQQQPAEEESPWVEFDTNCRRCGRTVHVETLKRAVEMFTKQGKEYPAICRECMVISEQEEILSQQKQQRDEEELLDNAVLHVGVRPLYAMRKPVVPYVFNWLMAHRNGNILLSGETGTGKSTSAGVFVREILREHHTVGMYYLSELLDRWRDVRCNNDNPSSIKTMFSDLEGDDYIVVDECAGKTVNSDSTREFMFRFLEDITNGACASHVVLLGNFYKGSIADMFGDEAPAMRRIREKFTCGLINKAKQTVVQFGKG